MAFTSFNFLVFLTVTVILYYLVPKKAQWCLLLLASYTFYLFSGVAQVFFILGTTLINYVSGRIMQSMRDNMNAQKDLSKEEKKALKKTVTAKIHRVQVITILIDLAVLACVKYINFLTENINSVFSLFHFDASIPMINIIVPLGISFYTFMSMGYILDIGRGRYEAEKNLGKFALFVSFFPSIVQGPINRYNDMGKQLGEPHAFSYENLTFGAQLILWGFFKKLVIADRVSAIVTTVFTAKVSAYSGSVFFFGMLAYAAQIYCDFSGGIDIARGAARILGVEMPQNFERPYFSTSVADYWRRWHITLGAWMRDYVFYSIMLSKPITRLSKFARKHISSYAGKMVPSVITPFIVFFLIGIWHGASWKYVAFGLYNATIVASSVAFMPLFQKINEKLKIDTKAFSWKLFQIIRTFLVLGISKILVRAHRLKDAFRIIKKIFTDIDLDFMFGLDGKMFTLGVDQKNMLVLAIAILTLLVVSILQETGLKMRETIAKQNLYFRWLIWLGLFTVVLVFGVYGPAYSAADFIYQAY